MAESVAAAWSRERVQTRLDELVRANRFTIAVVFPVVGAVLLVASAEGLLPEPLAFNPYLILLGTLVMRLPLIAGVAPLVGRREALGLAGLTAYAFGIELLGVTTGWPYGDFSYGIDLGPMLFGKVPIGLPIFFFPLVLNSYLLAALVFGDRAADPRLRLPVVIGTVLAVDLVLDPAAVALGFWTYADGGVYYGVPLSNYAGWVLSATVSVLVIDAAFVRTELIERVRTCEFMLDDLVSFVLLWGAINGWFANWAPVAVAGLFFAALVRIGRFDFAVLGRP
ncbi:MAG: bisanhydrobacterioruberin hydratase [Haloarculaceae archaeon]